MEDAFTAWAAATGRRGDVCRLGEDVREVAADVEANGPPAIVVAMRPDHAAWIRHILSDLGVAVPDDAVVAAATDGQALRLIEPSITVLDLDGAAHGAAAVGSLPELLRNPDATPENVVVPARFTVRQSSSRLAAAARS